jgi:hypothetical protein
MGELFNSDRLAKTYGKWRGAWVAGCATSLILAAAAAMKLVELATKSSLQIGVPLALTPGAYWVAGGLVAMAVPLWIWALVLIYKDQVHEDYKAAAQRYPASK